MRDSIAKKIREQARSLSGSDAKDELADLVIRIIDLWAPDGCGGEDFADLQRDLLKRYVSEDDWHRLGGSDDGLVSRDNLAEFLDSLLFDEEDRP